MAILDNFKDKNFWIEVLKLSAIFFVLFVAISLIISNASAVFSGNFAAAIEQEWGGGKWKSDLSFKLAITFIYSVYMTSRRKNFSKA